MKKSILFGISMMMLLVGAFPCCDFNSDFSQPEVVSITPADRSSGVDRDTAIVVLFSKTMDTVKTANEFSLSGDNGTVEGFFTWSPDGKRLSFQPAKSLGGAALYRVAISAAAEDSNGNDLKKPHSSLFSVSTDLVPPAVVSYAPPNDTMVAPDAVISIVFSEPVDLDSLYDGIAISPPLQGRFSWDATHGTISFTPLYPMPYGSTYSVTLNTGIKDMSGNRLPDDVFFNFTVGDDFENPTLFVTQPPAPAVWDEEIENQGIEKNGDIVIHFSEAIDTAGLRGAITITPQASFFIDSDPAHTTAYLIFTEPLAGETNYTLKISPTITDRQNNPLAKEYRFHFFTDGPNSIAPSVTAITDPKLPGGWIFDETQPLSFDLSPSGDPFYPGIRVHFSARMNPATLGITVDRVLGTGTSPRITEPDWPDLPPEPRLSVYEFDLAGVMAGNVYKITIRGGGTGAKDLNGNFLIEDFVQYIRF